jgi:hypothetical protein
MSDEQSPAESPAPATPAAAPAPAPLSPEDSNLKSSAPTDYALPAHHKSWLPTPALIRNLGCLFKLIVGFTVLICMGYFALVALNPKARQWALQGTKPGPGGTPPSGKGPTPFKIVNQILAIPAQALGKTDAVVKANNARVGQLDGVIAEEEKAKAGKSSASHAVVDPFATPSPAAGTSHPDQAPPEGAENNPASVSSAALLALAEKNASAPQTSDPTPQTLTPRPAVAPETPDEMKLAGDIVIAQASPAGAPRASAAFFYAIVKLNVSGITQGKPARALINNRLTYEGDEINRPLGITFADLDAANKVLRFRDGTGAVVSRSY